MTGASVHTAIAPELASALDSLPAVSLDEMVGQAALQTRVDRKYLVTLPVLVKVLDELAGSTAALQIDGRRVFGYSSVYFDTDDLLCYREHRQGRRRRFKVRTRTYLDSGDCMLEIKAVGTRGQTVKHRMDYPPADAGQLTADGIKFVRQMLAGHPAVDSLQPTLTTGYHRATLLDRDAGSRLTIDVGLEFSGSRALLPAPGDTVVVETKSPGRSGRADLALRRMGARPLSVSKYCIGVAVLHPQLPANRWHRVLRRHFHTPRQQPLPA